MNENDYIRLTLETHLFFDRIMMEHSYFIEIMLVSKYEEEQKMASRFKKIFDDILNKIIYQADGVIDISDEYVTSKTLESELKTMKLLAGKINTDLTLKELNLRKIDNTYVDKKELEEINKKTIMILKDFIEFKENILKNINNCSIFMYGYSSLLEHMIKEARAYSDMLDKLENKKTVDTNYVYEKEILFDEIMKEHAKTIRGLLDPSEQQLINASNNYAISYQKIIDTNYSLDELTSINIEQTNDFKKFKELQESSILSCTLKSIMNPLFMDHLVREALYFLKILNNYKN